VNEWWYFICQTKKITRLIKYIGQISNKLLSADISANHPTPTLGLHSSHYQRTPRELQSFLAFPKNLTSKKISPYIPGEKTGTNFAFTRARMKLKNLTDLALFSLTRCISCDLDPPVTQTFPLCVTCENALLPGLNQNTTSPYSLFQLTDSAYSVLRRWKTRRGPLFDWKVLKRVDLKELRNYLNKNRIQAIVPIPQDYGRSWKMGGSPALKIAEFVSRESGVLLMTKVLTRTSHGKRQAELSGWQRQQTRLGFQAVVNRLKIRSVLVVDDFSTTGHTLEEAECALRSAGYGSTATLCLGARRTAMIS
jgi:predicted amidophosphoribosyltransferase